MNTHAVRLGIHPPRTGRVFSPPTGRYGHTCVERGKRQARARRADDIGAALDLAVQALDRVCRVQLGTVVPPGRSCRPARRSRRRP